MIGIDISNWQRGFDLRSAASQIDFCILKASEFGWKKDPTFDDFAWTARNCGLRLGAYMFARDLSYGSVSEQVRFFMESLGQHRDACVLVLDFEDTNYNSHVQGDPWLAKAFLDEIRAQSGKMPLLYTSQSEVRYNDYSCCANAGYPLWGACYLNRNAGRPIASTYDPDLPSGGWGAYGSRPAIYQYSSTGTLLGWELDSNVCYLSESEWDAYAGGWQPEPVDPTHVDEDGWWGPATTRAMQLLLGSPYVDGEISGQYKPNWKFYPNITGETLAFDQGSGESWLVQKIQENLGVERDGVLGQQTIRAWQERLRSKGYGSIIDPAGGADGIAGYATCLAIQKSINSKSLF